MKHFAKMIRAYFGALVFVLSNGRILTRTASRELSARRAAWTAHAAEIQTLLDAQRRRGFGLAYIDGRRVER